MKNSAENDRISKEQLEEVNGGTYFESAGDAKKFAEKGKKVYSAEIFDTPVMNGSEIAQLRSLFEQYGVTIKDHGGIINANDYYIDGRQVTRDEAWRYVESQQDKF